MTKLLPDGVTGAIQLKGTAGILSSVAGMALRVDGNARGAGALDLQSPLTAATYLANVASGINSVGIGRGNLASGNTSMGFGYFNNCTGTISLGVGIGNANAANFSSAVGVYNVLGATATYGTAVGYKNNVSASYSSGFGYSNNVSGSGSIGIGSSNVVSAASAVAIGRSMTNIVANSVDIGTSNTTKMSLLTSGALLMRGAVQPATLTDAAAPNNAIYFSSTASKLVYKTTGGLVKELYAGP